MRYLVTASVKPGQRDALERAIEDESLGRGSVAGDEYLRNMAAARQLEDGRVQWVEVCYCPTPLAEERDCRETLPRAPSPRPLRLYSPLCRRPPCRPC